VSTQRPLTLIVEAEQALAEVLVQILDDMSMDAIWIRDPKDALAILNAPGQAVASALVHQDVPDPLALSQVAGRIPVVLLTDRSADYSAEGMGVRCILSMPFEIEKLEAALQACLDLPMTDGSAASSEQGTMQADD
jgi:DNA-binding NtrC family response regulator